VGKTTPVWATRRRWVDRRGPQDGGHRRAPHHRDAGRVHDEVVPRLDGQLAEQAVEPRARLGLEEDAEVAAPLHVAPQRRDLRVEEAAARPGHQHRGGVAGTSPFSGSERGETTSPSASSARTAMEVPWRLASRSAGSP